MSRRADPSSSVVLKGTFRLKKAVIEAPTLAEAEKKIVATMLQVTGADYAFFIDVKANGELKVVLHDGLGVPSGSITESMLAVAKEVFAEHMGRRKKVKETGQNRNGNTEEGERATTAAKVLWVEERIFGVLAIVREGLDVFSPKEVDAFMNAGELGASALAKRYMDALPERPDEPAERRAVAPGPRAPAVLSPRTLALAKKTFVGTGPEYGDLLGNIQLLAPSHLPVLILGESGTGKERVARMLHDLSGRKGDFVAINCAALTRDLIESLLFGHVKGAFTGAASDVLGAVRAADGGTLLLDEVGEFPLELQAKLLRLLQDGVVLPVGATREIRVNVRLVFATNKKLKEMVAKKTFREDLYFRLTSGFVVEIPPLRKRMTDLPILREHFLDLAARQSDKPGPRKTLSDEALKVLDEHDWPGNVRELKGVIETAYVFADASPTIEAWHLRFPPLAEERAEDDAPARRFSDLSPRSEHAPKKHKTDEELISAYTQCRGNIVQAAKLAGVDRSTMQRRLRRLGFRPPKS